MDFEGELLPLDDLKGRFNKLGYYITHMASDSIGEWEKYMTWSAKRDMNRLKRNPQDEECKKWMDKWYYMYFKYRRPYQGQKAKPLFEKLGSLQPKKDEKKTQGHSWPRVSFSLCLCRMK